MLNAAIRYAQHGYKVLPVGADKRPLNERGVHGATSDVETIARWWSKRPTANIAIATGSQSGVLVMDVDVRSGGLDTLGALEFDGVVPATVRQITGSGGEHWLFHMPMLSDGLEWRGKLGVGIDILAENRYFVASPSTNISGARYRWVTPPTRDNIAAVPQWLLEKMTRGVANPVHSSRRRIDSQTLIRIRRYLQRTPPAVSGQSGHTHTFLVAAKLVRGFGLDEQTALTVMREWNANCEPPWSDRDLQHKIRSAARSSRYSRSLGPPGA
jgi:hypothetical protein